MSILWIEYKPGELVHGENCDGSSADMMLVKVILVIRCFGAWMLVVQLQVYER